MCPEGPALEGRMGLLHSVIDSRELLPLGAKLLRETTGNLLMEVFMLTEGQERRQETEVMSRGKGKEKFVWSGDVREVGAMD